jgi:hypothetical protein
MRRATGIGRAIAAAMAIDERIARLWPRHPRRFEVPSEVDFFARPRTRSRSCATSWRSAVASTCPRSSPAARLGVTSQPQRAATGLAQAMRLLLHEDGRTTAIATRFTLGLAGVA